MTADPSPAAVLTGFVHAQINVSDLDRSIEFYEMVGFELISRGRVTDPGLFAALGLDDGRELQGAFLRIPGMSTKVTPMLDMIQFVDPPPQGPPYPALNHLGINRLCFQVDDLDAAQERLVERGVELVGPIGELRTKANMVGRVLCFKDPDGTILEYTEISVSS